MSRIYADLKAALKTFVRTKSAVFWAIAFPCMMVLLFGAVWGQTTTTYDLYLQNQDQTSGEASYWSSTIIDVLNSTNTFNIHMIDSQVNATDYALTNRLTSMVIIPKGFNDTANLALFAHNGTVANVTYVYDQSTSSALTVREIVMTIMDKFNFQLSNGVQYMGVEDFTIAPKGLGFVDFFLPAMIGVTVMTNSVFTAVTQSATFKQNGVFHKLQTTQLKRYEWILSRTIYNILIAYLSMAIMIGLGVAFFHVEMTIDALALFMVAMAALLFTGLGMILARLIKEPETAATAANVITFPMMFLSGSFWPLSQMPQFLQTFAQALPLTYLNEGLRASMIFGQASTAIFNTAIITGLGLAAITVGSWITKWKED